MEGTKVDPRETKTLGHFRVEIWNYHKTDHIEDYGIVKQEVFEMMSNMIRVPYVALFFFFFKEKIQ